MADNDPKDGQPDPAAMIRELGGIVRRIDNMTFLMGFKERRRDELIPALREALGRDRVETKFIDFDARRDPKTPHWCIMCQRDLDPATENREVRLILIDNRSQPHALHVDDEALFDLGVLLTDGEDGGRMPIGRDCARKLGKQWHMARREPEPLIPTSMEKEKSK